MILKIVRECYNGYVFEIVGENIKILEKRWKEWLLKIGKASILSKTKYRK